MLRIEAVDYNDPVRVAVAQLDFAFARQTWQRPAAVHQPRLWLRLTWLMLSVLLGACRSREVTALDAFPSPTVSTNPAAGPAPLRRLTRRQYENVLADVFGFAVPGQESLPDDAIIGGFEGAAEAQSPSELFVSRAQRSAEQLAAFVVADRARLARVLGCEQWASEAAQRSCLDGLMSGVARRLYRRPLSADETTRLREDVTRWTASVDFEGAMQLTLERLLQSPEVLYRPEPSADGFVLASRLSFLLWESAPDDELLNEAAARRLSTREQVRAQATRLLNDVKARRAMWSFHRQWLGLERLMLDEHAVRTPEVDARWTAASQQAALAETQAFVEHVMAEEGTLAALLTSRRAWLDAESARLYDVTTFQPGLETVLDGAQRSGVLTRVAFLASTSHRGATSPPIRGNAVGLKLLCRQPTPPPPGIDTTPPAKPATGARTTRQLYVERTAPQACAGCHFSLNALGFGFEHYDAAGRFRATEEGLPVDATMTASVGDVDGPLDGALELSARLARSKDVQTCATQMWVRYALGRAPVAAERPWMEALTTRFVASEGDVKGLLLDLVSSPTFLSLPAEAP